MKMEELERLSGQGLRVWQVGVLAGCSATQLEKLGLAKCCVHLRRRTNNRVYSRIHNKNSTFGRTPPLSRSLQTQEEPRPHPPSVRQHDGTRLLGAAVTEQGGLEC